MNTETRVNPGKLIRGIVHRTRHEWPRRIRNRARFVAQDITHGRHRLPELHLLSLYNRVRRAGRRPTLLVLPHRPGGFRCSLAKTLLALGWRVTRNPHRRFDVALLWQDRTTLRPPPAIEDLLRTGTTKVINGRCLDISKSRVARVFEDTFGYGMELDPTRHDGLCISKSEINATHEGRILEAPVREPVPGLVYHRLINNLVDDETILDLRTHIEGGTVQLVVRKFRHVDLRFQGGPNLRAELSEPETEFSESELACIAKFCRAFGLDHGTLDILRDADDGRIFIVDANKTPWGPPRNLEPRDFRAACRILARAFEEAYLDGRAGTGT